MEVSGCTGTVDVVVSSTLFRLVGRNGTVPERGRFFDGFILGSSVVDISCPALDDIDSDREELAAISLAAEGSEDERSPRRLDRDVDNVGEDEVCLAEVGAGSS